MDLPIINGVFPWQTVSHNQMVTYFQGRDKQWHMNKETWIFTDQTKRTGFIFDYFRSFEMYRIEGFPALKALCPIKYIPSRIPLCHHYISILPLYPMISRYIIYIYTHYISINITFKSCYTSVTSPFYPHCISFCPIYLSMSPKTDLVIFRYMQDSNPQKIDSNFL